LTTVMVSKTRGNIVCRWVFDTPCRPSLGGGCPKSRKRGKKTCFRKEEETAVIIKLKWVLRARAKKKKGKTARVREHRLDRGKDFGEKVGEGGIKRFCCTVDKKAKKTRTREEMDFRNSSPPKRACCMKDLDARYGYTKIITGLLQGTARNNL